MKKDPLLYVSHILEAIASIESFTIGIKKDQFLADRMRYDAVLHNLQTMAESSKRLPENIKQKYSFIPWRDIAGFRNIIVHDYLEGLDNDVLWQIISFELLDLKSAMLKEQLESSK